MIISSEVEGDTSNIMRDFKKFTSKEIIKELKYDNQESRKEWMLKHFAYAAKNDKKIKDFKFWQDGIDAQGIFLESYFEQKINYIHNNPVKAEIVSRPEDYNYSSAVDYFGEKGASRYCFCIINRIKNPDAYKRLDCKSNQRSTVHIREDGATFEQGISSGWSTAGIGAITGGVMGGVMGAGQNLYRKYQFNNGVNIVDDGVTMVGNRVDITMDNVDAVFDSYLGGEQQGLNDLEIVERIKGAFGQTEPIGNYVQGESRMSNVRISHRAFRNKFTLYNVLGHESVHVAQYYAGLNPQPSFLEAGAFAWNQRVHDYSGETMRAAWSDTYATSLQKCNVLNSQWSGHYQQLNVSDYMWFNLPTFNYIQY